MAGWRDRSSTAKSLLVGVRQRQLCGATHSHRLVWLKSGAVQRPSRLCLLLWRQRAEPDCLRQQGTPDARGGEQQDVPDQPIIETRRAILRRVASETRQPDRETDMRVLARPVLDPRRT